MCHLVFGHTVLNCLLFWGGGILSLEAIGQVKVLKGCFLDVMGILNVLLRARIMTCKITLTYYTNTLSSFSNFLMHVSHLGNLFKVLVSVYSSSVLFPNGPMSLCFGPGICILKTTQRIWSWVNERVSFKLQNYLAHSDLNAHLLSWSCLCSAIAFFLALPALPFSLGS